MTVFQGTVEWSTFARTTAEAARRAASPRLVDTPITGGILPIREEERLSNIAFFHVWSAYNSRDAYARLVVLVASIHVVNLVTTEHRNITVLRLPKTIPKIPT